MKPKLINKIFKAKRENKKLFAVLIDPEKCNGEKLLNFIELINKSKPDFIFIGGSQMKQTVNQTVLAIKAYSKIPTVLFIGNAAQFSPNADAMLILSLISGRNPDFLIGQHVICAQNIKKSALQTIPTGYILVDGGKITNVEKVSKTTSLSDATEIINTAIAGELLGQQLIYLEAGSGARNPVSNKIISKVKANINIPLIVGGGISSVAMINDVLNAGADIVVIGNHLEKFPEDITMFAKTIKGYKL